MNCCYIDKGSNINYIRTFDQHQSVGPIHIDTLHAEVDLHYAARSQLLQDGNESDPLMRCLELAPPTLHTEVFLLRMLTMKILDVL